ncbi:DegT/DnrJ/EryC1/StrS family aminotransferase [Streptomyces sp. NPDC048665]|uniref:DegT/DnrJ/EryC1/StrS family aminotransferase n=1 Tax=Streptomyces sp. NPDC048665 TaxID=3155490 RepID=UPI0034242D5D
MSRLKRSEVEPQEDHGFFGPGSVVWKVWGYPMAPTVGFQRAVVVEELDPPLVAAVHAAQGIYRRPCTRCDRTLRYFATVAFAGSRHVCKAAGVLVKVHSRAIGRLSYGGGTYDANGPASQLWIPLTGWHAVLYAYEKYGPGKLTAAKEREYWQACTVTAEQQTCSPNDIPPDRDGVRAYFERMRPQLSASPIARQAMHHLLKSELIQPPAPRWAQPVSLAAAKAQPIATVEQALRDELGVADVIACSSGTSALTLVLHTMGVDPDDEVVVPAYGCAPSANTVVGLAATPVFADIQPWTMVVDLEQVERAITGRTKAVVPAHMFSVMADTPALRRPARQHEVRLVEDSAVAQGAVQDGRAAGSRGDAGLFSFVQVKTFGTAGEGGAVVADDAALGRLVRSLRTTAGAAGGSSTTASGTTTA